MGTVSGRSLVCPIGGFILVAGRINLRPRSKSCSIDIGLQPLFFSRKRQKSISYKNTRAYATVRRTDTYNSFDTLLLTKQIEKLSLTNSQNPISFSLDKSLGESYIIPKWKNRIYTLNPYNII